jgi:hypothetical protein
MPAKAGIQPWDATRRRREPGCGLERREHRWLNKVVARPLDTWERADRFRAKSLLTEKIPCVRENIPCALA